jgi:hypothetical protein
MLNPHSLQENDGTETNYALFTTTEQGHLCDAARQAEMLTCQSSDFLLTF